MRQPVQSLSALLAILCAMPAWSAGSDELWEFTISMNMPGMTMPGMKNTSCIPKDGAYKPTDDPSTKDCKISDYKVAGNKVTWKVQCTGKDAMSGSGEVTKTANAMKGAIKMSAEGMEMTQTIDGKRVGSCDAGEEKKKTDKFVADAKTRSEEAVKQTCEDSAKRDAESGGTGPGGNSLYHGKGMCVAYQSQLCTQARARVAGYGGYSHYAKQRDAAKATHQEWGWVVSECGIGLDKQRVVLCKQAVTDKKYNFIRAYCPDETKQLNAKYCAGFGMDYTADLAKPNATMCFALRSKAGDYSEHDDDASAVGGSEATSASKASAKSNGGDKDKASAATDTKGADNPASKALDAAKKLKGVFGF